MAFQQNIELDNGINVEAAYVRIDCLSGHKGEIDLVVNAYKSKEAFEARKSYLTQKVYQFTPSVDDGAENFIRQGYEHLKTLQEFAGTVDLIE